MMTQILTTEKTDFSGKTPVFLILTAAGSSTRLGGKKKEFMPLSDFTQGSSPYSVLSQAALPFLKAIKLSAIAITCASGAEQKTSEAFYEDPKVKDLVLKNSIRIIFCEGGETRQQSVLNALNALSHLGDAQKATVLIHDGARPWVTESLVKDVFYDTIRYGAASPYTEATDSFKTQDKNSATINEHLDRSLLCAVQTPQGFGFAPLLKCHNEAVKQNLSCTDDTEVWDSFPQFTDKRRVHLTKGEQSNKKITYTTDLKLQQTRIGIGIDTHRLVEGKRLILGTVHVKSEKGEEAHSDGDVLLHAICDALLGASGLGDIGSYFPSDDPKWKDADSAYLLSTVWSDVKKEGWLINNIDCVIELEKPKFLPYRERVIKAVADILGIKAEQVFVKAKTGEGLDSIGRTDAVKATCICSLYRQN